MLCAGRKRPPYASKPSDASNAYVWRCGIPWLGASPRTRSRRQRPDSRRQAFQPSSRKIQILESDEYLFFWGRAPRVVAQQAAPAPASTAAAVGTPSASPRPVVVAVPVPAARFHSIAMTEGMDEMLEALEQVLKEGGCGGAGGGAAGGGSEATTHGSTTAAPGAVVTVLPATVVELAMAKTAGWALEDMGSGCAPPGGGAALKLLSASFTASLQATAAARASRQGHEYCLEEVASVLWGIASVVGELNWVLPEGIVVAVKEWLGAGETVAALARGEEAGRFPVLVSLLWGYAALRDLEARGKGGRGGGEAAAEAVAGPGLDALALRAAELIRAYGSSEPVAATELADVAWALSVIGRRSPATAQLVEAVAHEVYRQLSNRSSAHSPFAPVDLGKVVRAFAELRTMDGSVPRMLDAVGGHVAKRIRNRHVGALTRPADCVELLRGFADVGHNSVVVPELLRAIALQISREVAAHSPGIPCSSSRAPVVEDYNDYDDGDDYYFGQPDAAARRENRRWKQFLSGSQVISVLQSYLRLGGHYPGSDLMDSLLLAVRPQLPYMSPGEVSELVQLLAAVRHVPGPQTLELLAHAALRRGPERGGGGIAAAGSAAAAAAAAAASTAAGAASCSPLQRLAALWSLVMMGWQPEAVQVQRVLAPILVCDYDDDDDDDDGTEEEDKEEGPERGRAGKAENLRLGIEDAGRLMSLLAVLPRSQLTIQRFGLAAMRLRQALAAPAGAAKAARRINGGSGGGGGGHGWQLWGWLSSSSAGGVSGGDGGAHQRQLRFALRATGVAMALLGDEGWEMAEQVLPGAHFRAVEDELRGALAEPYEGLDASCVTEAAQALGDLLGCTAAVTSITLPVDALRLGAPAATEPAGAGQDSAGQDSAGEDSAGEKPAGTGNAAGGAAHRGREGSCEQDEPFAPLVFRPLAGRLQAPTAAASAAAAAAAGSMPAEFAGAAVCGGGAGTEGSGVGAGGEAHRDNERLVLLHVCSPVEVASNAAEDASLLWGWVRLRLALLGACCPGAAVVALTEARLRQLKGRREDVRGYVQRALARALSDQQRARDEGAGSAAAGGC